MKKRTVLITGSSSGIGLTTALYLTKCGFRVYAGLRNPEQRIDDDLENLFQREEIRPIPLDVTSNQSIRRSVATVMEQHKDGFDLVSNAGINIRGYFEDLAEDDMRRVFDVNLFGTMRVIHEVLPVMRRYGKGRIVCISSTGGRMASPASSAYCSSKFAMEGFGESLAQEVRPFGIFISLVEPGFVNTALFGKNRMAATAAVSPESPYGPWFQQLERLTDEEVRRSSLTTDSVAKTIHLVLTSRNPRLRYVVGRRASILFFLRRYIPGEIFERFWLRELSRRICNLVPSSGDRT